MQPQRLLRRSMSEGKVKERKPRQSEAVRNKSKKESRPEQREAASRRLVKLID